MDNLEKKPALQLAKLKEIFDFVSGTRKTFLGLCYGWQPISREQVKSLNENINIALVPGKENVKKIIDTRMLSCLEAWSAQLEFRLNMSEDGKISFASDGKIPAHTILSSASARDRYTKGIQVSMFEHFRKIKNIL